CTAAAPPPPPTVTLSLHDALPIFALDVQKPGGNLPQAALDAVSVLIDHRNFIVLINRNDRHSTHVLNYFTESNLIIGHGHLVLADRKSTRLNSSHVSISYAVFCLK